MFPNAVVDVNIKEAFWDEIEEKAEENGQEVRQISVRLGMSEKDDIT